MHCLYIPGNEAPTQIHRNEDEILIVPGGNSRCCPTNDGVPCSGKVAVSFYPSGFEVFSVSCLRDLPPAGLSGSFTPVSCPGHTRVDAANVLPSNDRRFIDQPWPRRPKPAFERRQGRRQPRQNLHRPRAVNLHSRRFRRVDIAAGSRTDHKKTPRALAQLEHIAASLHILAVRVEAVDETGVAFSGRVHSTRG